MDPEEGTQEVLPDPVKASVDNKDEARETHLDPEETQGAPSDSEGKTREAPLAPMQETRVLQSHPEDETL